MYLYSHNYVNAYDENRFETMLEYLNLQDDGCPNCPEHGDTVVLWYNFLIATPMEVLIQHRDFVFHDLDIFVHRTATDRINAWSDLMVEGGIQ